MIAQFVRPVNVSRIPISLHTDAPTRASVIAAKAQQLRDRADLLDSAPPNSPLILPFLAEVTRRDDIATHVIGEAIADTVFGEALDELPLADEADCRAAALYASRKLFAAWQSFAFKAAEAAIAAVLVDEVPPQRRGAVAILARQAALAGFLGVMEGTQAMSPGDRLRVAAGMLEKDGQ